MHDLVPLCTNRDGQDAVLYLPPQQVLLRAQDYGVSYRSEYLPFSVWTPHLVFFVSGHVYVLVVDGPPTGWDTMYSLLPWPGVSPHDGLVAGLCSGALHSRREGLPTAETLVNDFFTTGFRYFPGDPDPIMPPLPGIDEARSIGRSAAPFFAVWERLTQAQVLKLAYVRGGTLARHPVFRYLSLDTATAVFPAHA